MKAQMGRVREKRRVEERRSEKRKSQKKEDADARKGRKVAKHFNFPMICGSGGSKSRLAVVARSTFASEKAKNTSRSEHFWKLRCRKSARLARSTFRSQNVQNTTASDHFWKVRCQKSACRCGAKHISKSKCTKHTILGPLLEGEMSKKCTPLWRKAHFEVKMYKTHHARTTFGRWDVEKVHAVVARSTFRSQNVQNTPWSDHFWKVRCRKSARRCGAKHISKSKCFKHYRGSDHFWRFRCRFASLHYTTFHYITLQDITLHSSTLHYTTLHSGTLHYTKLHYTTLHYTEWHCTTDRQVDRQTDR